MKRMKRDLLLEQLAHDQNYGCYSRQGFELVAWPRIADDARFIIFADIDDMHSLNQEHGYSEVDRRIRNALQVRSEDVMAIGRWYSGDEIVWVIQHGDPEGMIKRLQAALAKQGLSATFAFAPVDRLDLVASVAAAASQVQAMKRARGSSRGV